MTDQFIRDLSADARRAMASKTRSAKPVAAALHDFLMTPAGNWPDTDQAWRDLGDAVDFPGSVARVRRLVMDELVCRALASGWKCHPSRRDS
jgi:hypothetical protein